MGSICFVRARRLDLSFEVASSWVGWVSEARSSLRRTSLKFREAPIKKLWSPPVQTPGACLLYAPTHIPGIALVDKYSGAGWEILRFPWLWNFSWKDKVAEGGGWEALGDCQGIKITILTLRASTSWDRLVLGTSELNLGCPLLVAKRSPTLLYREGTVNPCCCHT